MLPIKGKEMKNYFNLRKKSNNATGKIILGTIAGMALGLTAGILTAPRAGKEIRDTLASRTNEALEKVGNAMHNGKIRE